MSYPALHNAAAYRRLFPFLHLIMRFVMRCFAPRLRITGKHNVPFRGAVLLTPNHTSDGDPPFLYVALRRAAWYMAKRELWIGYPKLGAFMDRVQTFPVDRDNMDRAALQTALDLLARGEVLVVFPEGKISPTGELAALEAGAMMLAIKSGAPVVPVGIVGSTKVLPYQQTRPRFTLGRVRVHFGPPLTFADLADLPRREQRRLAMERLETALRDAVRVASG